MTEEKQELRFIELCSDTTFKYLYKNPKTRFWFNNIIKKKTGIDLDNFELIDNEQNTGNNIKDYRLDAILRKEDVAIVIEMNGSYHTFTTNKSYQYLFRVAGNLYKQGEDYSNKQAKLILFNNFKNKDLPEMKIANFELKEKYHNLKIDDIESFEIYLPNFKEICYHKANEEDISLSLFICSSYSEMRTKTNNPKDIEIIEELERLAMNEDFLFDYDAEEERKKMENSLRKEGIEEGIEIGINQGINQEKIEIAKQMLSKNIEIKTISECTGLTIEEIESLK